MIAPASSPLEKLPSELLRRILLFVTLPASKPRQISMPVDPNIKLIREQVTLLPALLASRTLYNTTLPIIYRDPDLHSPSTFELFVHQISQNPRLGSFIRRLDLTHLAPTRSITGPWSKTSQKPLLELLSLTPLLRELRIDRYLGNEIDVSVLELIFGSLNHLQTLEFDNCTSPGFNSAFSELLLDGSNLQLLNSITSLDLRGCYELNEDVFSALLPALLRLTSLDVSNTQITSSALSLLPSTARLQHLDISFCSNLQSAPTAKFLITHPSTSASLRSLRAADLPESRIFTSEDLSTILTHQINTGPNLRSLSLQNSNLASEHVPLLQKVLQNRNLEFLSVGSHLQMQDVESMVLSTQYTFAPFAHHTDDLSAGTESKYAPVLGPMDKAISVCKLRRRMNSVTSIPNIPVSRGSSLRYLDVSSMSIPEQAKVSCSVLLGMEGMGNLEVIEMSNLVMGWNEILGQVCRSVGWRLKTVGRRCWIERERKGAFERSICEQESETVWNSFW